MSFYRCVGVAFILFAVADPASTDPVAPDPIAVHREHIADWRERRDERLKSESGWLTLVGMDWLKEGENRVGSDPGQS